MNREQGSGLEVVSRQRRERCVLVYALAPDDLTPAEANRTFNEFVADPSLPLVIFHDHFIGSPGGVAVFHAPSDGERSTLVQQQHLKGWLVEMRPLIFSHSPSAFDEQTAFTLSRYRGADWGRLRLKHRPRYGSAANEAETAQEDDTDG